MNRKIHIITWSSSFSWTATEDCWVLAIGDTKGKGGAAQVKLNGDNVVSVLDNDPGHSSQASGFFPCRKGDIVSKAENVGTVAMINVYGMR